MRTCLAILFSFIIGSVQGQISFTESQTVATFGFRSGAAVVSIDINGDTKDDLVRLNGAKELQVDLQYDAESFFTSYQTSIANFPEWNLVAGDINGDGWIDIVTSGGHDKVKVLKAVPYSYDFQVSTIDDTLFLAQASNIADMNGDGYQDIFVCNDDGLNHLYLNDGTGEFERTDTLIDFNTIPPSDNSGNYGSLWVDFDMDDDLDLYIAKCRAGVINPADPRRINALYVNTDTGYVEMADSFGLDIGAQSWCSDFADIDNDGDFDIIIINHDVPSQLLENTGGGMYTDISVAAGIDITGGTIQSIFRDFDNDGYVDLLVSGITAKLYRNLGDNTFEEIVNPFGGEDITSFTIGDFNSDGFPDVYGIYNSLYNTPSNSDDDKIWINDGNANNFLRIKAIGTGDNASAIGARIFLHTNSITQMREIRAGESYGICTSPIKNFGLDTSSVVDSVVIVWMNGDIDTHYNLPVNTTITMVQGSCFQQVVQLDQGPFPQCGSDTFTITAPEGFDSYLWSNGSDSQSIQVTEPGLYLVSLTDSTGCLSVSSSVRVGPCVWPSDIVYVDSSATGDNSGVDWPNAFTDLQLALDVVDSAFENIKQIWVAEGTYFPTNGLDRNASFTLVESISIYGGFEGDESILDDRDIETHPTRLSGDIGISADSSDNSFHVIVCPDAVADVRLDGFIIRDGFSDGVLPDQSNGAGVFCEGKMSLYNCAFQSCFGTGNGVYIYNSGSLAEIVLNNCTIDHSQPNSITNLNNGKLLIQGLIQIGM